jgi:multidrug efflux pump
MLEEVARVLDDVENTKLAAWQDLTPAVLVNIQRQPGANTIQVVDRIRKLLPHLVGTLPRAVHVAVVTDRTTSIRTSVRDVEVELLLAIALVVLVIFLFLRSLAATLIPSIAVPLSLIGTFGVMYLLGYSINNLAMMALTIATGFVVDDAIVMIENITRYIEARVPPLQAALQGAQQIGFTILSLTVSLIAVLIPLLFMENVAGRLFRQFAVTLATTIILSAFVSLTLTPMMCARLLRPHTAAQQGRLYAASERVYNRILAFYGRTLRWVLSHQPLTLLVATATVALTGVMYLTIPKGFFPTQDTGIIQGISQAAGSRSFAWMKQRQLELVRVLLADPAVARVSSFIGADGINITLNSGRFEINLKPLGERGISATELVRRLNRDLRQVQGIRLYMRPVQDLTVDDRVSRTAYQYTLEDPDQQVLDRVAGGLVTRLEQLPQLSGVTTDQQPGGLATVLDIDRATAARFGITPQAIDDTLYDAFGQRQVNTLYTQVNQYHVILETDPRFQQDPRDLGNLYIPSSLGSGAQSVPMNTGGSSSGAGARVVASAGNALLTPGPGGVAAPVAATSAVGGAGTTTAPPTAPGVLNLATTSALSTPVNTSRATTVLTAPTVTLPISAAASAGGVSAAYGGAAASPAVAIGSSGAAPSGSAGSGTGSAAAAGGGTGTAAPATPVPLSAFTHMHTQNAPLVITRQGQFPAVTISFNLGKGYSLGDAISAINRVLTRSGLPGSVISGYQGTAAAFEGSQTNEGLLVLAAIVTVYIVLGVLYESFVHPLTILSTLPSAALGALLALRLFGLDLDIVAIIGIILLIGIVQKNGIMMVDFALETERREGKSAAEAIYQAAQLRLRPILMTTMAALLSGVPLAFGTGIGSELRRPLGVAMVGGLLVSQLLTLYTTPVIYIFFGRLGARLTRRAAGGTAA